MKTLRYVILLALAVTLLAGCAALPPVMPNAAGPTAAVLVTPATEAPAAPTALPPAETPAATPDPAVTTAPAATAVVTTTGTTATDPLVGGTWEWTAFIQTDPAAQSVVPDPTAYTLTFGADGQAAIQADCNRASGTYAVDGEKLSVEVGAVTEAACPPGSLSTEYLAHLGNVATYLIEEGDLVLRLAGGDALIFRTSSRAAAATEPAPAAPAATAVPPTVAAPQPPAAATEAPAGAPAGSATPQLVGPTWEWESFFDVATGANSFDVANPANYTVTFALDGTATMRADCNRASGAYTVNGAALTVEVGPVTLATCEPGSRGAEFLINLTSAGTYMFVEGQLTIDLQADGGRMVFGIQK